jgi:hypothetical protein
MRFFHHFLTTAHPYTPLGNDDVWVHEIPQFAAQNTYLMHAILSLGASHLSRLTGVEYRRELLVHRGHAIAGLNQALGKTARSYGESDAMLATCHALALQAICMGDDLNDFITMVRGCALATAKVCQDDSPTAFNLLPDLNDKLIASRLNNLPNVDSILLQDAYRALEGLHPHIVGNIEVDFYKGLVNTATALQVSSMLGYAQFAAIFDFWGQLSADRLKVFLDPSNLVTQLLLTYFIGIFILVTPLITPEWPNRGGVSRVRILFGAIELAEGIFRRLEGSSLKHLLDWPKSITTAVAAEINGDVLQGPSILRLH